MRSDFSRPLAVERIGPTGTEMTIDADAEERQALARRFAIPAIYALSAKFVAMPWRRGGVVLRGKISAEVEQLSVVSLEPVRSRIVEQVVRYFQAAMAPGHKPAVLGVEALEDEEPEVISGGAIDLGEIAAEELALALDPYPRRPGEVFRDEIGQDGEEPRTDSPPDSPFAVLARLKEQ
jgi:uncharacterized metal-binding protein YceD (DUF177 family)